MRAFLLAGLLYLVGTSIILFIKPSLMFTNEGVWKEFGIGRNPATHTWLPFWLFAIVWAIVSYILSLIIIRVFFSSSVRSNIPGFQQPESQMTTSQILKQFQNSLFDGQEANSTVSKSKLPSGYYVLNTEYANSNGPSYVYLGRRLPED